MLVSTQKNTIIEGNIGGGDSCKIVTYQKNSDRLALAAVFCAASFLKNQDARSSG